LNNKHLGYFITESITVEHLEHKKLLPEKTKDILVHKKYINKSKKQKKYYYMYIFS